MLLVALARIVRLENTKTRKDNNRATHAHNIQQQDSKDLQADQIAKVSSFLSFFAVLPDCKLTLSFHTYFAIFEAVCY